MHGLILLGSFQCTCKFHLLNAVSLPHKEHRDTLYIEKAGSTSKLLHSSLETAIVPPPDGCREAVGPELGATVQQHEGNIPRPFLPLSFLRLSGILFPKKTKQNLKTT